MDRQHRRELKRDKFVDELGTLSTRARENQRLLVIITGAAVVVALIVYGIYFYRSNREKRGDTALAAAIQTMDSPLLPPPGQPQAQAQPGAKFKTEKERAAAAEKQFKDLSAKYSGTDAADVAGLYLARFDAGRGDTATAKKLLQEFVSDHPKHFLVGSARYSLYQLRIEDGQAPAVVTDVQAQLAKPADQALLPPDTLLVLLAHAYDAQGDIGKSRDAYRRITTEFPDSPYAIEAQRKIGNAGAGSGLGGMGFGGPSS
ncbi:MAG TPA: tetratricopeptide repeat protein [Thermoanaerobaculia bacterium]|jgi:TolA-binding protein